MTRTESQFTLSAFADEIDQDFETQLEGLNDASISAIDLRRVDGTNVLELSESELDIVEDRLHEYDIEVASIGSPIGKISVTDDFEPHLEQFRRAVELADRFDTPYIRLFSYWMPEGDDPADHREEVLRRMQAKVDIAEQEDVVLLHENEKDIYGDTAARCRDLFTTIDSPHLRAIFDPANFLEVGVHPYPDALVQLVEYVEYLHIKDAVHGERHNIKPAGEGDGEIPAILEALSDRGFTGYAALEPHLLSRDERGGYSGREAFMRATDALVDIVETSNLSYR